MPKETKGGCKAGGAPSADECIKEANAVKTRYGDKCAERKENRGK